MNRFPRPEDALADRLRGMQDAVRALQRRVAALEAQAADRDDDEGEVEA